MSNNFAKLLVVVAMLPLLGLASCVPDPMCPDPDDPRCDPMCPDPDDPRCPVVDVVDDDVDEERFRVIAIRHNPAVEESGIPVPGSDNNQPRRAQFYFSGDPRDRALGVANRTSRGSWSAHAGASNEENLVEIPSLHDEILLIPRVPRGQSLGGGAEARREALLNFRRFENSRGLYRVEVDIARGNGDVNTLDGDILFLPVSQEASAVYRSNWNVVLAGPDFTQFLRRLYDAPNPQTIWWYNEYPIPGDDAQEGVSWVLWIRRDAAPWEDEESDGGRWVWFPGRTLPDEPYVQFIFEGFVRGSVVAIRHNPESGPVLWDARAEYPSGDSRNRVYQQQRGRPDLLVRRQPLEVPPDEPNPLATERARNAVLNLVRYGNSRELYNVEVDVLKADIDRARLGSGGMITSDEVETFTGRMLFIRPSEEAPLISRRVWTVRFVERVLRPDVSEFDGSRGEVVPIREGREEGIFEYIMFDPNDESTFFVGDRGDLTVLPRLGRWYSLYPLGDDENNNRPSGVSWVLWVANTPDLLDEF